MSFFSVKELDLDVNLDPDLDTNDKEIEFGQPQLAEFYKNNEENIQSLFSCPITCFIPSDPVVADDGNIYEEDAISTWHTTNSGRSPLTNQKMSNSFQTIPLWNEIIKMFVVIDPELKDKIAEKDYTFKNNKETIRSILNSKQKHANLLKYKDFILDDNYGYGTFASTIFSSCDDINIIKHILENSIDFKMSDNKYNIFEYACHYSTPEIIKYFISNGYSILNSVNGRLIALTLINNDKCMDDIEIHQLISNSLKNTFVLNNGTPLIVHCVMSSPLSLIKMLIESGHDPLMKNNDGDNLLKIAMHHDRDDAIILYLTEQIQLKNKDIVDQPIMEDGRTVVHCMLSRNLSRKQAIDTIKQMIQIGVNMEVVNPINSWRPIHYICRYLSAPVISYVMGIGVDLTVTCMHDGGEVPPLALLEINGNIKDNDREQLLNEFFQFIELQNLAKN